MKQINIDIETYSSTDLAKAGVYKYADDPSFTVLLFSYSVDHGPVECIECAKGEKIPEEIIIALEDPDVIKVAFNSMFERICLGRYMGTYLPPDAWRCTMVASLYLGLPGSLALVGAVLGLEKQKLTEGKDLIKYFSVPCKPTKTNGGRTRNLPEHDPEKWDAFVRYNIRDVETEMGIGDKISRFPVPDYVWEQYILDQRINDTGIRIDMTLARQAIRCDEECRERYLVRAKQLTGLENPNSPIQLKEWLIANGAEVESLSKKEVAALLASSSGDVKEVLQLRQLLSKSSVKKYTAMETCCCSDGRAHGLFQYYGANRTGRWCLTGDHEVLTQEGWVRLDEWCGGNIACWNKTTEAVSFQKAVPLSFDYEGDMYTFRDGRIDQCSTPDHKMWAKGRYDTDWGEMTVKEMSRSRPSIPLTGYRYHRGCANPAWLRVLVMTQADGHYTADGAVRFHFKKKRKIERCKALLRKAEIAFVQNDYKDAVTITVPSRAVPLWLREFRTKTFGFWLLDENPDIFFDELPNWDGYFPAPNSIQYCTCNKQNADIVQALAHMSGRTANMRIRKTTSSKHSIAYVVDIWLTPKNCHEIRNKAIITEYSGKVYCASTSTGYFLVRRNGKVWVTGNSGKLIQLQNLPQNRIPDLAVARKLIRAGYFEAAELLYDSVPDLLSQLIRTAFVPREGCQFLVADFSAVEARALSWMAGEKWRMDVFARNGDIYCASASQMFGVPVEKHGVNGELRQKGKIAELALGYNGSVGALKAMGAIEMGLKEEELKPIVDSWRAANPKIVQFWWDVDRAIITAVKERRPTRVKCFSFRYKSGFLIATLPSGRSLFYAKPRIEKNQFDRDSLTYEGVGTAKHWERIETFGGKATENITQALCRDLLAEAMQRLDAAGYRIVMHVHDEVVIEAPMDADLGTVCEIMSQTPSWAPGLVLSAAGYTCPFYQKD